MLLKFHVLFLFLLTSAFANAELEPFRYLAHPLDAAINTANLVASDAPMPMTQFQKNDWRLAVSPVLFKVDQATFTSEGSGGGADFRGENLKGYGGSLTFGYAFADRWQVFGIFSGISMSGNLVGKTPATAVSDQHRLEGRNSYLVLASGVGYELLEEHSTWSATLYAGLSLQRYASNLISDSIDNTQPDTRIDGSGVLLGTTSGVQATYLMTEKFSLSPYFFLLSPFSKPKVSVEVTDTNGNSAFTQGQTISGEIGDGFFIIPGCNLTYKPWNLGLNLSGLITSFYSKQIYEGLALTKLSISYSWGK